MIFQYQIYKNDCLLACIYSLLLNNYKIKFSYKQFIQNFDKFGLNLLDLEQQLLKIGIKINTFKLDPITIQSIDLSKPIIFLQNNNALHSCILYKKNKYNFVFCPILGYQIISNQQFLKQSLGIFIKIQNSIY